jgi:gentisate 1,2-dioxygenase
MQLLPRGFQGDDYRATDGTVFCALEGTGQVRAGDQTWDVAERDVFVIPSWQWHGFIVRGAHMPDGE